VFWPTVSYSFLNWDDNVYVLKNPWIRGFTWTNLRAVFTQPYFQNYLPLHLLTYMLDHALWGLKASGYHLSSILLHGLNSVLCLAAVRRLSGSRTVGFLAALLFAVHPSHVEAVAWISSRKEVLSTTFLLLSLLAYLRARKGKVLEPVPYAASVACFLLAMLSKVSVVVLPAFLLLLDWLPDARTSRAARPSLLQAVASKIPYAIIGAILIVVNSSAQVTAKAAYAHEPLRYLTVKGHAVWNYLGLLFGFGGRPDYDLPRIGEGFAEVLLQLAGLAVLPVCAYLLLRWKRRVEFLGLSWVFITLLPALLFPLVTYMADRYLYAPSIGFCWTLAAALVGAGGLRRPTPGSWKTLTAVAASATLVLVFSLRTLQYSKVWKDSESLWTYALTKSSDYRAFNNLAEVRLSQKRWDEAERLLKRGAAVENVVSYQSLGVLYYNLRRFDEALAATDRALEIQARKSRDPALTAELRYNRGAILWAQGNTQAAAEEWRAALREDPGHAQAKHWLGTAAPR
jgi:tetratricopeptide (TPR) repeat protein